MKKWNTPPVHRLRLIFFVLVAVYFYLAGGLFYRQIIRRRYYDSLEKRQSYRRILRTAPRGNIYDRNGNLLAGNRPQFSLMVHLIELRADFRRAYGERLRQLQEAGLEVHSDREQAWARFTVVQNYLKGINALLGTDYRVRSEDIERHFHRQLLLPMVLVRDLSTENFARLIEVLPVDGPLQLQVEAVRFYPHHSLAAHLIGYASPSDATGTDAIIGDDFRTFSGRRATGRSGVESFFDGRLQGRDGGEIWIVDPSGRQNRLIFAQEPVCGENLVLSLDLDLQRTAEAALGHEVGCLIVSRVQDGEILAMASHPTFDLNELTPRISEEVYRRIDGCGAWLNQAIQGLYPPGSAFKIATAVNLLVSQIVDGQSVEPCDGGTRVGNRTIACHNHYERGDIPFGLALAKSCNSFFVNSALRLELADFLAGLRALGFGGKNGLELPYESSRSLVPSPKWKRSHGYSRWTDGDTANLAIGQGFLLVTPLQINALTASIAAGRRRTNLSVLHPSPRPQPTEDLGLDPDQYDALVAGLCGCVEYGSGRRCRIDGLKIVGKTGTAQIFSQHRKSHLAWFTAFAPADAPEIAVTVMVAEPVDAAGDYGGGSHAAPVARKIFLKYFNCGD